MIAVCFFAGCTQATTPDEQRETEIRDFAQLAGLRNSPLEALHSELKKLEQEEALPTDLASNRLADENNLAALLVDRLPSNQVGAVLPRLRELTPVDRFEFSPLALEQAIGLRRPFDPLLAEIRQAVETRPCNFAVDFRMGFAADRAFVDRCELVVGLEAFQAAEQLSKDQPIAAVTNLRAMLLLIQRLAAEKTVEARLAAANLRVLALQLLEAIVQHPGADRATHVAIEQLVDNQLESWPPDAAAWIGDRAMVLHSYEVIREGHIIDLLTSDEVQALADEGVLHELPKAAQKVADQDELFYLQTMRRVIEQCKQPYHQRLEMLDAIRPALHARRNKPDFPLAAARFFLPRLSEHQAAQAHDRARVEAWAIALRLALGGKRPDYRVSPFSGQPYTVTIETTRVVVEADLSLVRPAIVPVLPPATARR